MRRLILVAACAALLGVPARAVTLDLVPIGDPNAADGNGFGAVADPYFIGRYEVTNVQYADFLNAVAKTDTHGLYDAKMDPVTGDPRGGIERAGSPGSYTYTASAGRESKPVVFVSWYDTLRFANWLHNGQPTPGIQDEDTTEDGAYTFTGTTSVGPRNPGAIFFLPTEDEWYKAAYYDAASASYHLYPFADGLGAASCETQPGTTGHSANCDLVLGNLTDAGVYATSPSSYGTYDQGGNVWEWNETPSLRGGSWDSGANNLAVHFRSILSPTDAKKRMGFRIASASAEPACNDGTDNDGDGFVDSLEDPGCAHANDTSERSVDLICDDGQDNDADGGTDFDPLTFDDPLAGTGDPSCWSPLSDTEVQACQNGHDDNGDGLIDFDGGASLDLDGNGFVDAPFNPAQPALTSPDPGCADLPWKGRERPGCGLGFELVLLLPALRWLRGHHLRRAGLEARLNTPRARSASVEGSGATSTS